MPCFGHGPRDAKIVIVGEAPGREEEIEGRPFSGASGRLLTQMLEVAGINRNECYITNVMKIRPNGNDFSQFYLDGEKRYARSNQLEEAIKSLFVEIREISPNLIILVGDEALKAIAGKRGITKWRGSILPSPLGKCIGILHPAYVLRDYLARPIVELDLKRCSIQAGFKDIIQPKYELIINPSFEECLAQLRKMFNSERVALDIETTRGGLIRSIAFSDRLNWAISIPFMSLPKVRTQGTMVLFNDSLPTIQSGQLNNHWREEEEMEILKEINNLLSKSPCGKIGQNISFDSMHLAIEFGINTNPIVSDTMLGFHTMYSELPKGLDFLASIYTEVPYYSDYDAASDEQLWTYNALDAMVTFEIDQKLRKDLGELNLIPFYETQVIRPLITYIRASSRGVKIDVPERDRLAGLIKSEITRLESEIKSLVGDPNFNPSSPKQMGEFIYDKLKIPEVLHHKTKKRTTDKNSMEKLQVKYPQHKKFFESVADHGSKETIISGFYKVPLGANSRIYTSFNIGGTTTGRLSSSKSPIFSASTNLQNRKRPEKLESGEWELDAQERRCFVADAGWSIIKADLSQAEFRLVVWFAKIQRLIDKYIANTDFDIHRWVASLIFHKPEEQISKKERSIAKNGVYGGNYDMHYVTASRTYKIPLDQAKFVLDEYRRAIPEIPLWWKEVQEQINLTRMLENPFGRKRFFFDRIDQELYRSAYAHLPQSTVGDIINKAASDFDRVADEKDGHLLLQVHDELVGQARDECVVEYAKLLRKSMSIPITFPGVKEPLIIPVDVSVGKNWLETVSLEEYEKRNNS